ncbi:PIN domain-containing protein [Spectribacter hydrogenoxidans]|uniref:PIN domain-containing protein n=1 Tax=Spectribacter hydrogenoxidans TaxID=3075608 RepID=A0ABU3BYF6_9GAMM|nr:PIN domain-containing protein [Salinisphaera sp. W335]MDT0634300.1 PIN domain-containing protein [Salinisphaera sp. W335]
MSADFLDSNVLVYLFDDKDQRKRDRASAVVDGALAEGSGVISFQVVQETLNIILTKLATPATPTDAGRFLNTVLAPLWHVMPSPGLYRDAVELQPRYGYSFYDSLIIAAAREAGCRRLLTEDMQHGQRIGDLVIENPFSGT